MSESQLLKPSEIKANVPKLKNHDNFHQWDLKLRSQLRICGIISYLSSDNRPIEPYRLTEDDAEQLETTLAASIARRPDEIDAEAPPLVLSYKEGSNEPTGVRKLNATERTEWQYWATRESRTRSAIKDTLDDSIAPLFNHHKSAHEMYQAICIIYRPADDRQLADQYIRQINALKLKKDSKSKDLLKHLTTFNEINSEIITYGIRLTDSELVRLFTGSLSLTERLHVGTAVNALPSNEHTFTAWQREFANYVRLLQLYETPSKLSGTVSATMDTSQYTKDDKNPRGGKRGHGRGRGGGSTSRGGSRGGTNISGKSYTKDQIEKAIAKDNWCKIHERIGHSTDNCGSLAHASKILEYSKLEARDKDKSKASGSSFSTSKDKEKSSNGKASVAALCASITSSHPFEDPTKLRFLVDNGSDVHLTSSTKHLVNVRKLNKPKRIGLGFTDKYIMVTHLGDMPINTEQGRIVFYDVHVSSETFGRILSQSQLSEEGWTVNTEGDLFMENEDVYLELKKLEKYPRLTFLSFDLDIDNSDASTSQSIDSIESEEQTTSHIIANHVAAPIVLTRPDGIKLIDLHNRIGHLSRTKLLELIAKGLVKGVTPDDVKNDQWKTIDCPSFARHKTAALPRPGPSPRGNAWGEMVHCDIKGPINPISFDGQKYLCSIISDVARHREFHPMKSKAMAGPILRNYIKVLQKMTGLVVKIIRTDGGGEFNSLEMRVFYADQGIQHHISPPGDPALNGPIEHFNRTASEHISGVLTAAGLPNQYWSYGAIYISNVLNMTTFLDDGRTAYEAFNGRPPNLSNIRPFGERVHVRMRLIKKMDTDNFTFERVRSKLGRVLCREPRFSAWWILLDDNNISLGRDIYQFNPVNPSLPMLPFPEEHHDLPTDPDIDLTGFLDLVEDTINAEEEETIQVRLPVEQVRPEQEQARHEDHPSTDMLVEDTINMINNISLFVTLDSFEDEEGDYATLTFEELGVNSITEIISATNIVTIKDNDESDMELVSVYEAMHSPDAEQWREAMHREIEQFDKKNTWIETTLPDGRRAITAKRVFKRKRDADGNITKYKARLVARGFTQIQGVDYDESYAPVARMSSLRLLFTIAAVHDLELGQVDVEGAYLNGSIEEEIYLAPPAGVKLSDPKADIFRIKGSLYGLKQSGRVWWQELYRRLTAINFERCPDEWGLYRRANKDGSYAYISAYVDDLIIATITKKERYEIYDELKKHWTIQDLGEPQYILGIRIERDRLLKTITLSQPIYCVTIAERFSITPSLSGRHAPHPVGSKPYGELFTEPDISDTLDGTARTRYQEIVGTILWVAGATRPDMAFCASFLGRVSSAPTERALALAKRALGYIIHTKTTGVTLGGTKKTGLEVFADANHAACLQTRRSTTGIIAYFHGSPITWSSRRQATVSQSSTEAEFIAASEGAREAIWLRRVLDHLGFPQQGPTPLYIDNEAAIKLGNRPTAFPLNKHIDIRQHMLRDYVAERHIKLNSVKTAKQRADVLTKPLAGPAHQQARTQLRLAPAPLL
ncbi:hypothetical protein CspeluHIS016_0115140 [Cutaneotrichosporon spelunceum]|uniref:Integrase catalytic domain-containing protein n=1 Tax=Cutaneotrichosporon spelunceum TaxID=1672016 RepID=A0AAD3TQ73_9TREE|nr:hypothetical protein CspeluHIS016_0115140 [Cutaneotrichosporon spelunceum]